MNSIPLYRDFGVAGELAHRPSDDPSPARRGLLRRVIDAIERSRQRAANREIARFVGGLGPDDRSPTKWSVACFNISPAIAASGRERPRNLSEVTDNDYTDTVAGRALPRERPPHSTFAVADRGPCRRRNCHRARDTEPP